MRNEETHPVNCKTCQHGETMFERDKEDKYSTSYRPLGWSLCSAPRYKGRKFPVRDRRRKCDYYKKIERKQ